MDAQSLTKHKCLGEACEKDFATLQCPTCLKLGLEGYYCSQECFKKNWSSHKLLHGAKSRCTMPLLNTFNPFPDYAFTGPIRPVYPLSNRRIVPSSIAHPDYSKDGIPYSARTLIARTKIRILDEVGQNAMRKVCRLAREVLDIAAAAVRPGITTDYLDEIVHKACVERQSYPSPLNYNRFPKSVCTSVNEVVCHGIPDQRVLLDGDILNIDVTLYHDGYHGDLNETYYVGDKAMADDDSVRVVEAARECLNKAVELVKPGVAFRDFGKVIEGHAKSQGCSVIRTYCGHGINSIFHCPPNIPHYAKNKATGVAKEGMCFTIEPMVALGTHQDQRWPDAWTSVTRDGKRTAQFEHTLLVTADGVEILTARFQSSPGGPITLPAA